jgi:hypothetical protein
MADVAELFRRSIDATGLSMGRNLPREFGNRLRNSCSAGLSGSSRCSDMTAPLHRTVCHILLTLQAIS